MMCGYYGCHVLNDGECECVHCTAYQMNCGDCTKFPNRVRASLWLTLAMQKKCDACKDIEASFDAAKRSAYKKQLKMDRGRA
jgi:hypothetical protein